MDQQIFFLINRDWAHPSLDLAMAAASSWDFWWPFLVVVGVGVLARGGFHARAMVLAAAISVGVTDGLVVGTLKGVVGRPRPHEALEGARTLDLAKARPRFLALGRPLRIEVSGTPHPPARGNSFPSGHASNNFAFATVIALFYRRLGWLAFFPAAWVSYSRIYVGSHWPLDVVVSCFIGAGIAWLVVAGLAAAWRRLGPRWMPALHAAHAEMLGR